MGVKERQSYRPSGMFTLSCSISCFLRSSLASFFQESQKLMHKQCTWVVEQKFVREVTVHLSSNLEFAAVLPCFLLSPKMFLSFYWLANLDFVLLSNLDPGHASAPYTCTMMVIIIDILGQLASALRSSQSQGSQPLLRNPQTLSMSSRSQPSWNAKSGMDSMLGLIAVKVSSKVTLTFSSRISIQKPNCRRMYILKHRIWA